MSGTMPSGGSWTISPMPTAAGLLTEVVVDAVQRFALSLDELHNDSLRIPMKPATQPT